MKIGILTLHTFFNYGAMLQAFALQTELLKLGYDAKLIDYYPRELERKNYLKNVSLHPKSITIYLYALLNPSFQKRFSRYNEFRNMMFLTKRYYDRKELYNQPPEFDVYIAGSDQIWNCEKGLDSLYFLDFIKGKKNKISYASSFGTFQIPEKYYTEIKELLSEFKAISTREDDGVKIVKEATEGIAEHVLDPTLLLNKDEWQKFIKNKNTLGDFILIYGLNKSVESLKLIESVRKRYKMPVVGIPLGIKVPSEFNIDKEISDAGPIEFISLVQSAKVICTSSFHGLAFAINFEKTFFVVPHPNRNSRLNSLLKALGLQERQTYTALDILNIKDSVLFMDYTETRSILNRLREKSINYLKENITTVRLKV